MNQGAPSTVAGDGARHPPFGRAFRREFAATFTLALPLVATNLAQIGLGTADVVLLGRLGPEALAAGALGTNLYFALAFLGIGLVSATAPLMAEAIGARRHAVRDVRRTVRQGLWSCLAITLPVWAILWQGETLLLALGQQASLAAEAGRYLRSLQWGLLPFLAFAVLRCFLAALERPGWGLAISLAAIPMNVGLAIWLIGGGWGVPPLGLVGAGVATSLTSFAMFVAVTLILVTHRRFRRWHLFGRWWRPDAPRFRRLWILGIPIAATLAFEVGVFNAAGLAIGRFGAIPLAAHAIALQIAAALFMVPLGIAQAATVRVGIAYGAGDREGMTQAGRAALVLAVAFMAVSIAVLSLAPRLLIEAFVDRDVPANQEVIRLGVALLFVAAIFQLADGLQAVAAGLLRGIQDTRVPMLLAGLGYWGIGATLGVILAFPGGFGPIGIWIGLATGLGVVAVLMLWRWRRRDSLLSARPG
ncbi:MATE family efflux transporter [Enterovirga rhinocerotis]|uniref:Multidrug-efflux transporter n=1 Tax=Enterovirga rhinocerotis TaxID=1339210 RepID=A0A4V3DXD9_9HYPH|nr:MATE family efflux transporter [Enterovirga rhinocerotis]TDR88119.1 MATE family multidrug resistance protein [Enterovirga rhinocerotis]